MKKAKLPNRVYVLDLGDPDSHELKTKLEKGDKARLIAVYEKKKEG